MSMISMIVGGVTDDGATFVSRVDNGPVRVAVADDEAMTSPVFTSSEAVDAQGVAKVSIAGLDPDTRYWWQVEDDSVLDTGTTGTFLTHPLSGSQASFTFVTAGDAGLSPEVPGSGSELLPDRISNIGTFDVIRQRALAEGWLFFAHLGDILYYNFGDTAGGFADDTLGDYRRGYDDILDQSNQARLYRELAFQHVWDDHEFGPNNSDGTHTGKANAAQAYREREPHYPLAEGDAIYHSWQVGRVLFVASDVRYYRTPNVGDDGLVAPGASGDYATTPDHASLDITGDIDLRADATIVDWTNAAPDGVRAMFIGKWLSPNRSYAFAVEDDGRLSLHRSTTGTNSISIFSTASVPITSGRLVVRGTLDVDNGAAGHDITFYTAPSMVGPWTQLGAVVTTAGTTSIFSGTEQASVAAVDGGSGRPFAGTIHAVEIRNGIDGTVVANPDFAAEDAGTASFADGTGKTWTVQGNAEIIDKTMLGAAQKAWMDGLLGSSDAEVLVWLMPSQWLGLSSDSWDSFQAERDELVAMLDGHGWLDRMVMLYADHHGIGIDSGGSNDWGGFPVLMAASLDATPSAAIDPSVAFDVLNDRPGREQYGTVTVTDLGSVITVRLTAWQDTTELGSLQLGFTTSTPPPSFAGEITDVISGSHRATFEARVLTTFQTGDDPDGTEIAILDGDVQYDATAQVFATLSLTTNGMDERRRSLFPRRASDLLAPYGHEVFVRRGIDVGSEIVWVPLGYFRLEDDEQPGASDQPIRLSGQDRMSGIIDGELPVPRQFAATNTAGFVVMTLVEQIYPGATIVWDDASNTAPLGRQIIVERDRYAALLDIAESLGKIMYWDGEGILRIETAPDPDDLVWDIKAGHHGVLVDANRRVGRDSMANGIVAIGEGGDTNVPVMAIAVDAGPNSPTRWFPPDDPMELWFGQVPGFFSSPLLTTGQGARSAAISQLRRRIGMPYSVGFGAVVNPALRPRQAVRITHKDGNRERHIVDTVTIPLVADRAISGTTREQTSISIANIVPGTLTGDTDPGE